MNPLLGDAIDEALKELDFPGSTDFRTYAIADRLKRTRDADAQSTKRLEDRINALTRALGGAAIELDAAHQELSKLRAQALAALVQLG